MFRIFKEKRFSDVLESPFKCQDVGFFNGLQAERTSRPSLRVGVFLLSLENIKAVQVAKIHILLYPA